MKSLIVVIFLLFQLSAFSQSKALVIYAFPGENASAFSLSNKLYDAIQESESKLIVFVSNGKNPLVCNNIYESQKIIDKVSKLKMENLNVFFDLDSLNKLIDTDSLLSTVKATANELKDDIDFFFFFDAKKCRELKLDQKIAEKLLLANRLLSKDGLAQGCRAKLYIQSISSKEDTIYFRKIKDEGLFSIIEY